MVLEYFDEYKKEINGCINDLKCKDTFYKQIPNLLTFSRLVGGIPAGLLYFINPSLSIMMIALLWFTDAIDGRIAKKYHIQSKLGADMDAFADKIMFLSSSLPLMANISFLFINFIFEGVISLINVIGRINGLDTRTVFSGKLKTVSLALTLVFGYFVHFFGMSMSILNILIPLTTGLQIVSIKDYVCEYKRLNKIKRESISCDIVKNNKCDDIQNDDRENNRSLIEQLRHDRELLLGMSDSDNIVVNKKSRKLDNKKKRSN